MVGVEHQCMAGREAEWVLVLFLRKYIVGGAELFDGRVVEPCAFLHFRRDQQTLAFDLRHFWLDIPSAADRQRIGRDVAAVKAQHTGDSIPKGRFAVPPAAVRDDESFHKDLPDSGQSADHLDIVDELLILAED
jgi:hypothetical protein